MYRPSEQMKTTKVIAMDKVMNEVKYGLYILLCVAITSCGGEGRTTRCYVCNTQQRLSVADFVSKNIAGSNNMSDEEMEDVIEELRDTGIKLLCSQEFVPYKFGGNIKYSEIKKDTSKTYYPYLY